ncbi:MAG: PEGA domain-containing protein [Kofleriaceae bacterium]
MRSWWALCLVGCATGGYRNDLHEARAVEPLGAAVAAPAVMAPQPWKVGQWVLYRWRLANGDIEYLHEAVVARDSCGLWVEQTYESEKYRNTRLACWKEMPDPSHADQAAELLEVMITKHDDDRPVVYDFRGTANFAKRYRWREFATDLASPWYADTATTAGCPQLEGNDVTIDSNPPGATVYLNSRACLVGSTPWTGSLPAGDLNVIVEAPTGTATKPFHVATNDKNALFVEIAGSAPSDAVRREDIDVPAGHFAGAFRKPTEHGDEPGTRWFDPAVPISGEVKVQWTKGDSAELIAYGQTGAHSIIPTLVPAPRKSSGIHGFYELGFGNGAIGGSDTVESANGTAITVAEGFHVPDSSFDVVATVKSVVNAPYSLDDTQRQTSTVISLGARWTPFTPRAGRFDWTAFYVQGALGVGFLQHSDSDTAHGLAAQATVGYFPTRLFSGAVGIEWSDTVISYDSLEGDRNQIEFLAVLRAYY